MKILMKTTVHYISILFFKEKCQKLKIKTPLLNLTLRRPVEWLCEYAIYPRVNTAHNPP